MHGAGPLPGPLLPAALEAIGENPSTDPDPFIDASSANDGDQESLARRRRNFWLAAHELSCLKHASLHTSAEATYDDTFSASLGSSHRSGDCDRARRLDLVRGDLTSEQVSHAMRKECGESRAPSSQCRTAYCTQGGGTGDLSSLDNDQIDSLAGLVACLLGPTSDGATTNANANAEQNATNSSGWSTNPFSLARRGISYAMERLVDVVEGEGNNTSGIVHHHFDEDDDMYQAADDLEDVDDAVYSQVKLGEASPIHDLGNRTEIISLNVVASTCRMLLDYAKGPVDLDEVVSDETGFFRVPSDHGQVEKVMLSKNGMGVSSLASFVRFAGAHFSRCDTNAKTMQLGEVLSNLPDRALTLIIEALVKSNYAHLDGDVINLFPGGVPSNHEANKKTDEALFQIHSTKLAIQSRIRRLEADVQIAKQNAVKAKRSGSTALALTHMRRRQAALDEVDRCATILTNLDTSELSLERAKGDKQLVQTFTTLKMAMQEIRSESGVDSEDIYELMSGIREDAKNSLSAFDGAAVEIDEDELNAEFKLLEEECAIEAGELCNGSGGGDHTNPVSASERRTDVKFGTKKEPSDDVHARVSAQQTAGEQDPKQKLELA